MAFDLVIDVENTPGALAEVTSAVSDAGVNLDLVYIATRDRVVFGADDPGSVRATLGQA